MVDHYTPPARPRLPDESQVDFSDPAAVKRYIASLNASLVQLLAARAPATAAPEKRLFMAEDGSVFALNIESNGQIRTTLVKGPKPP